MLRLRCGIGLFRGYRRREHRNECALPESLVEFDVTFNGCKNGVILAHANALARPPLGAALPDDDVAWECVLASEEFHAQAATG